jgi:cysteine desulfurase
MLPFFTQHFGNPSGAVHQHGRIAEDAVEKARVQVANLLDAKPTEIAFTAGATESNNLAILGLANAQQSSRKKIITTTLEHKAILEPLMVLEARGFEVCLIPALPSGLLDLETAFSQIDEHTLLVSVQLANNELGTIQPLKAITEYAHQCGSAVHTDASQAVGKIPVLVEDLGVDLLSLSGHKFYAPKGIGALYVRGGISTKRIAPLMFGGGQEHHVRNGTLNVPAIVGLGKAAELAQAEMQPQAAQLGAWRDHLEQTLQQQVQAVVNGQTAPRLPGSSSLTFAGIDSDALLLHLPELSLSTGSACTSGALEPSHVLTAIGLSRDLANATIRVGIGRMNTQAEIETAIEQITQAVLELRRLYALP